MTIGQQLKKSRLLFGLTQEEMSAGIVSESFYSRAVSYTHLTLPTKLEV